MMAFKREKLLDHQGIQMFDDGSLIPGNYNEPEGVMRRVFKINRRHLVSE